VTKVIVIGGGIGGLTAAAALGRAGVEVAVFERAPQS
jgi:phytoene dehydrogenase-like protein